MKDLFFACHPERRGRRGDRGVEGTLWLQGIWTIAVPCGHFV